MTTTRTTISRPVGTFLFVAAIVLPLLRTPGVPSWDTIWLEDAPIYVEQANSRGPFAVVARSYAGYLQLTPRLLALPTASIPAPWLAVYLAVAATTVGALAALFVYRSTARLVSSPLVRLMVAAMVVIGPAVAVETTATITNTIWTLLAVLPFAFISENDKPGDVAARSAVAFLGATATVLAALFVPLALGYAILRRTRACVTVALTFMFGIVLQAAVVLHAPNAPRSGSSLRVLADMFGLRVLGSFLVGERPLDDLWTSIGEPVAILFTLAVVAIFARLLRGAGRANQRVAIILLVYAVLGFVVPALGRGTDVIGFGPKTYTLNMTRYTISPILWLVTAAAILVDPMRPRDHPLGFDGRKVLLVQTAIVIAVSFITPTVRGQGPSWRDESARVYQEACGEQPSAEIVRVTTTPTNFSVALPCHRLQQ